jgi:hypothetical protein
MKTEDSRRVAVPMAAKKRLEYSEKLADVLLDWLDLIDVMLELSEGDPSVRESAEEAVMGAVLCLADVTLRGVLPEDDSDRYAARYQASLREVERMTGKSSLL